MISSTRACITIPQEDQVSIDWLFGNKVVVVFESRTTAKEALQWICAFNKEHEIKLTLQDELFNDQK